MVPTQSFTCQNCNFSAKCCLADQAIQSSPKAKGRGPAAERLHFLKPHQRLCARRGPCGCSGSHGDDESARHQAERESFACKWLQNPGYMLPRLEHRERASLRHLHHPAERQACPCSYCFGLLCARLQFACGAMRVQFFRPCKGHSQAGNMHAARALLDEMAEQGVAPDARAVNAFFRGSSWQSSRSRAQSLAVTFPFAPGCLYHGDVPLAGEVFDAMQTRFESGQGQFAFCIWQLQ